MKVAVAIASLLCVLVVAPAVLGGQIKTYGPTSIVSVTLPSKEAVAAVHSLAADVRVTGVDWYDAPFSGPSGIAKLQISKPLGERSLAAVGITIDEVLIPDLDEELREVFRRNKEARENSDPDDFFAAFRTIDEINQLMDDLHEQYPNITEKVVVGQTLQGRDIRGLQVSAGAGFRKPSVVHQAAHHAREWGTIGPVCYAMQQMVTLYGSDEEITAWVDAIEFTFIPVMNVDAYIYTWEVDRNQRKNMRPPPAGYPASCIGIDLNRNWNYDHYGDHNSQDPCSGSYRGTGPESEPEVATVASWLRSKNNVIGFVDWHTSGNMWMGPFGANNELPDDYDLQYKVAEAAAFAVETHRGTSVKYGTVYTVIYPASGLLVDWAYGVQGIPLSYATELGRTHNPPDSEIWPTCLEWWLGIVEHSRAAMELIGKH